jgi:hypothetical protein
VKKNHYISIGNAFIWAAAILATALLARGSEHSGMIVIILSGAAGASIIFVAGALRKK